MDFIELVQQFCEPNIFFIFQTKQTSNESLFKHIKESRQKLP